MTEFVAIETLLGNALLERLKQSGEREITFNTLVRYGEAVADVYRRETGDEIILLLSRKYQVNMLLNHPDLFVGSMDACGRGTFGLTDKSTVADLEYFRWGLSASLRQAFEDPEVLQILTETKE